MKTITPIDAAQNSESDSGVAVAPTPANSSEWHVYQLNDCDWWMGRTLEEAKADAAKYYGCSVDDEEMFDREAHAIGEEGLNRMRFHPDGSHKGPTISFREELDRRIAAGETSGMFATTEF